MTSLKNRWITDRWGIRVTLHQDFDCSIPPIEELGKYRPIIQGSKLVTIAKDNMYLDVIKYLLDKYRIFGGYCGLAAARAPEIYTCLYPHITGFFDTFQYHKKDYKLMAPFISKAAETLAFDISLYSGDIVRYMQKTDKKCAVIDIDGYKSLNHEYIQQLVDGLINCAADTCLFCVWHTPRNKNGGDETINKKFRPYLQRLLAHSFIVCDEQHREYYETQSDTYQGYPMRIEAFVLKRKELTCRTELPKAA